MRRLLLPCLLAAALCAVLAPAASANQAMFSIMMDDDQLLYRGDDVRDGALKRMKALGVDYARVTVLWRIVAERAKYDRRGKRRRNFDPANPRTYPRGNWDRFDRLVRAGETLGVGIYFNLTYPGPRWAHKKPPRRYRRYRRTWMPNPREFFKFVKAVGRRYDGTYVDENDGRKVLPRVSFWSIGNEPNQQGWLTPQWRNGIPMSPKLYRELWYYGRAALDATNHASDIVLIGETAPLGSGQRNVPSPIYPKRFIRELFCVSSSGNRYTGGSAARRGCGLFGKMDTFRSTAWAHHPYTKDLAPTRRHPHRDAITMANIGELTALLDQMGTKTGRMRTPTAGVLTEFGYETDPPDPFSGVTPAQQAEYLNVGDYLAYRDARIFGNTQFLLRDVAGVRRYKKSSKKHWFTYQSGLFNANGTPKPSAAAYNLPFMVTGRGTDPNGTPTLSFWGQLRFIPNGVRTEVQIQHKPAGSTTWSMVGDPVPVPGYFSFFEAQRPVPGPGTWRAVWVNPATGAQTASREVIL